MTQLYNRFLLGIDIKKKSVWFKINHSVQIIACSEQMLSEGLFPKATDSTVRLMTAIKIIVRNSVLIDATNYSHYKNHSGLFKRVLHFYEVLVWKLNLFQHFYFPKMSPLFRCNNKLTVCSAIKEFFFFFFFFTCGCSINTRYRGGPFSTYHEIISVWQLRYCMWFLWRLFGAR